MEIKLLHMDSSQHGGSIHYADCNGGLEKNNNDIDRKNMELGFVDSGQLADFELIDKEKIKRHVTVSNEPQGQTTLWYLFIR